MSLDPLRGLVTSQGLIEGLLRFGARALEEAEYVNNIPGPHVDRSPSAGRVVVHGDPHCPRLWARSRAELFVPFGPYLLDRADLFRSAESHWLASG